MHFWLQVLETEYNTCLVTQIALVVVTLCESIPETRERQVQLHWPERNRLGDRDVDAAANVKSKALLLGDRTTTHPVQSLIRLAFTFE